MGYARGPSQRTNFKLALTKNSRRTRKDKGSGWPSGWGVGQDMF